MTLKQPKIMASDNVEVLIIPIITNHFFSKFLPTFTPRDNC